MLRTAVDDALSDHEWQELLLSHDFGQLIATGASGALVVTPSHFLFDGEHTVELHVHRANPILPALRVARTATLAVVAAHAYIPTQWNADDGQDPMWAAPTSYYAAVQVRGAVEIVDDFHTLADLLRRQMAHFQPEGGHSAIEAGPNPFGRMLVAIRGIRLHVEAVEAKFKFGGNRTREHRLRIAQRLAERGHPRDFEAREHLLRRTGSSDE